MALEDRIRTSVNQAIDGLVNEIIASSESEIARTAAEIEQRLQAEFNVQIAYFEQSQRRQTDDEVLAAVTAETARATAEAQHRFEAELQGAVQAESAKHIAEAQRQFDRRVRELDEELQAAVLAAEARGAAATEASMTAARAAERELEMAGMTRLVESIRGLDGATSLSEVLDALGLAAARETARAAVVVVKGDRIVGWRVSGFGARDAQPKSIDLDFHEAGVIGIAASSSRMATTHEGQTDGPGFDHLPPGRTGLALPVLVGGRVVAVVYADGGTGDATDKTVPSPWPEAIEILARHAGRCLEALTVQKSGTSAGAGRKAPASSAGVAPASQPTPGGTPLALSIVDESVEAARRLARLLVSEIRLFHEPAVREGCESRNLVARLAPQIAQARAAYDARTPQAVRARTDVFQQELVRTLAGGDASLLGALG